MNTPLIGVPVILLLALGLFLVIFVIFMWGIVNYNSLVALRNTVKTAFSQIEVQLQRRYDLIPNLVEVAKKYMSHERGTLEAVVNARNSAQQASRQTAADPTDGNSMKTLISAEQNLTGALSRLFALREAYPDLKADTQMSKLMQELSETENKVSTSRESYNGTVMQYNTKTEQFPTSIIAGLFKFHRADFYQVENEANRQAPKVVF